MTVILRTIHRCKPQQKKIERLQRTRYLIPFLFLLTISTLGNAQELDSVMVCEYPDEEAQPPFPMHELLNHLLEDSTTSAPPTCFDSSGSFYINALILADGTVALCNLECVHNQRSCVIVRKDGSTMERWVPAVQNGRNCAQKIRMHVYLL